MKKLLLLFLAAQAFAPTLEWDANTETNLAGYRVYTGHQSWLYDTVLDVGNQTEATLATVPGTTFYAVTAYDTDGLESDFSNEVFYTKPVELPFPLGAGHWAVESTFVLGDPTAWIPYGEFTGPGTLMIPVDTGVPHKYFRARLIAP